MNSRIGSHQPLPQPSAPIHQASNVKAVPPASAPSTPVTRPAAQTSSAPAPPQTQAGEIRALLAQANIPDSQFKALESQLPSIFQATTPIRPDLAQNLSQALVALQHLPSAEQGQWLQQLAALSGDPQAVEAFLAEQLQAEPSSPSQSTLSPEQHLQKRFEISLRSLARKPDFEQTLLKIYGEKARPHLPQLIQQAKAGTLPMPALRFVPADTLQGNQGAYSPAQGGMILLNQDLQQDPEALLQTFKEEYGHFLDEQVFLDPQGQASDTLGDEGQMLAAGLKALAAGQSEAEIDAALEAGRQDLDDSGEIELDGQKIKVEFRHAETKLPASLQSRLEAGVQLQKSGSASTLGLGDLLSQLPAPQASAFQDAFEKVQQLVDAGQIQVDAQGKLCLKNVSDADKLALESFTYANKQGKTTRIVELKANSLSLKNPMRGEKLNSQGQGITAFSYELTARQLTAYQHQLALKSALEKPAAAGQDMVWVDEQGVSHQIELSELLQASQHPDSRVRPTTGTEVYLRTATAIGTTLISLGDKNILQELSQNLDKGSELQVKAQALYQMRAYASDSVMPQSAALASQISSQGGNRGQGLGTGNSSVLAALNQNQNYSPKSQGAFFNQQLKSEALTAALSSQLGQAQVHYLDDRGKPQQMALQAFLAQPPAAYQEAYLAVYDAQTHEQSFEDKKPEWGSATEIKQTGMRGQGLLLPLSGSDAPSVLQSLQAQVHQLGRPEPQQVTRRALQQYVQQNRQAGQQNSPVTAAEALQQLNPDPARYPRSASLPREAHEAGQILLGSHQQNGKPELQAVLEGFFQDQSLTPAELSALKSLYQTHANRNEIETGLTKLVTQRLADGELSQADLNLLKDLKHISGGLERRVLQALIKQPEFKLQDSQAELALRIQAEFSGHAHQLGSKCLQPDQILDSEQTLSALRDFAALPTQQQHAIHSFMGKYTHRTVMPGPENLQALVSLMETQNGPETLKTLGNLLSKYNQDTPYLENMTQTLARFDAAQQVLGADCFQGENRFNNKLLLELTQTDFFTALAENPHTELARHLAQNHIGATEQLQKWDPETFLANFQTPEKQLASADFLLQRQSGQTLSSLTEIQGLAALRSEHLQTFFEVLGTHEFRSLSRSATHSDTAEPRQALADFLNDPALGALAPEAQTQVLETLKDRIKSGVYSHSTERAQLNQWLNQREALLAEPRSSELRAAQLPLQQRLDQGLPETAALLQKHGLEQLLFAQDIRPTLTGLQADLAQLEQTLQGLNERYKNFGETPPLLQKQDIQALESLKTQLQAELQKLATYSPEGLNSQHVQTLKAGLKGPEAQRAHDLLHETLQQHPEQRVKEQAAQALLSTDQLSEAALTEIVAQTQQSSPYGSLRAQTLQYLASPIAQTEVEAASQYYQENLMKKLLEAPEGSSRRQLAQAYQLLSLSQDQNLDQEASKLIDIEAVNQKVTALAQDPEVLKCFEDLRQEAIRSALGQNAADLAQKQLDYLTGPHFEHQKSLLSEQEYASLVNQEIAKLGFLDNTKAQEASQILTARELRENALEMALSCDSEKLEASVCQILEQIGVGVNKSMEGLKVRQNLSRAIAEALKKNPFRHIKSEAEFQSAVELAIQNLPLSDGNKQKTLNILTKLNEPTAQFRLSSVMVMGSLLSAGAKIFSEEDLKALEYVSVTGALCDAADNGLDALAAGRQLGSDKLIGRMCVRLDDAAQSAKLIGAGGKFAKCLGPAGSLCSMVVDGANAYHAFSRGDTVGGVTNSVSIAAGAAGTVAGVMILAGATGPGAPLVLAGAAVVGLLCWGIDAIWGDSSEVVQVKEMLKALDIDYQD